MANKAGKVLDSIKSNECLPIIITYDDKEHLIALSKLDNYSGSEQHFKCLLTEFLRKSGVIRLQIQIELVVLVYFSIIFACRHHYGFVLKCLVFPCSEKIWKNFDPERIERYSEKRLDLSQMDKLEFYRTESTKEFSMDDYRELIEL